MKFTKPVEILPLQDETTVVLHVDNRYRDNAGAVFGEIEPEKDYTLSVKKMRSKRSLDANAYCWVLIGKLAEKLKKTNTAVYRELIRDFPCYEILPIREDSISHWVDIWEGNGIGWMCEDFGECRDIPGYHYIKSHYGTKVFNSKQMSDFIDIIIEECKTQGIEYLPEHELLRLKEGWK